MEIEIWIDREPHKLDQDLGFSIWNIAINNAPYRTGNLRNQIKLQSNSKETKRIVYYDQDAYYMNYLEEGVGRNKKHKGFIENKTTLQILSEVVNYLQTGHATYSGFPIIVMRSDVARNYERKILRQQGLDPNLRLTANDRAILSKNYVKGLPEGMSGQKNQFKRNFATPNVFLSERPDSLKSYKNKVMMN